MWAAAPAVAVVENEVKGTVSVIRSSHEARLSLSFHQKLTIVQPLSVQSQTEGDLDTGPQSLSVTGSQDTRVVNLELGESGIVQISLGTDFKGNTPRSRLGVVDSLGTGFDVFRNLVVVRGRKGGKVSETVDGDGVVLELRKVQK